MVSAQRGAVIDQQNTIITRARDAWVSMKKTYSKSLIKRSLFGG